MDKFEITNNICEKLENANFSAKSLAKDLNIDKKTINRHLYAMETLGLVSKNETSPPVFALVNRLENKSIKENTQI